MSGREEDLSKEIEGVDEVIKILRDDPEDENQIPPDNKIGSSESGEEQHSISNCNVQSSSVSLANLSTEEHIQSSTCRNPSTIKYPGQFRFGVIFVVSSQSNRTRNTEFSVDLNKLYIDMNKWVEVRFSFGEQPHSGLYFRALPIFAEPTDATIPVKRCPNHARPEDPSNYNFPCLLHLIRFDSTDALYCEDLESERLSVVIPLHPRQEGSSSFPLLIEFMCLGSDVGGINRRPLQVVFTLEDDQTNIIGRDVVNVRICCCPRRDKLSEEARLASQGEGVRRYEGKYDITFNHIQCITRF